MQWYTEVLKKYVVFTGRARRKEYWMFTLFSVIISIVLSIVDGLIGTRNDTGTGLLSGLYSLAVLLPTLGVTVRRLHDTNRTGWWILIGIVPIIGWIVLIVFLATEGNAGDNQHGPDPKAAERFGTGTPNADPGYPTV
ncbi:uncharacterized membrane protein YhaH (DUF805 family) [Kribbella amoyensis]|uniref:Uncharacterized membrane protein YhaH (DUF805 family) n=1 Tax=Kribbella amoyensis TaxID=996641 RepID=A0A561BY35_9ACTN|nr:DUF805 domain-containing protein [Kribbella amoyensis]TWD83800.1 uncharacterized membrane protein YhaH (DUF805 family) [Kribbella amoyensis]